MEGRAALNQVPVENNFRSFHTKGNDVLDTLYFAASIGASAGAGVGAVLGAIAGIAFACWAASSGGYVGGLFIASLVGGALGGAVAGAVAGSVVSTVVAAATVAPYSYFFGKPRCVSERPRNICSSISGFFRRQGPVRQVTLSDMIHPEPLWLI
jgi:hypothetical protein